jgi:hypothetical protein
VTAYWVTRCDGFRVVGLRRTATVERTIFADDPLQPFALRVRTARGKHKLIPLEAVEAVTPALQTLYVRRPASVARRAAVGVSALGPHGRRAARWSVASTGTLWRTSTPRARAAAAYTASTVRAATALSANGARAMWPHLRRWSAIAVDALVVLAILVGSGVVLIATASLRLVRFSILSTRRLAPRGVRLATETISLARRPLR